MTAIREWATILALAALAGAMLELLAPSGAMEKMVRFVLGAFMICAVLTPLAGTVAKISFDFPTGGAAEEELSEFQRQADEQALAIAAGNIKYLAAEALEEEGVIPEKIEIFMDTSDKGSISFIRIIVCLSADDAEKKQDVAALLEEKLGLETEIRVGQG